MWSVEAAAEQQTADSHLRAWLAVGLLLLELLLLRTRLDVSLVECHDQESAAPPMKAKPLREGSSIYCILDFLLPTPAHATAEKSLCYYCCCYCRHCCCYRRVGLCEASLGLATYEPPRRKKAEEKETAAERTYQAHLWRRESSLLLSRKQ